MCVRDLLEFHEEFRTALFLSSLTLGTFLFAMKSLILQTVKREVYDNPYHQDKVASRSMKLGETPKYYAGLSRFSKLIISAISLSLLNAFVQVLSGFFVSFGFSLASLILTAICWSVFAWVLYQSSENISSIIDYAQNEAEVKRQSRTET